MGTLTTKVASNNLQASVGSCTGGSCCPGCQLEHLDSMKLTWHNGSLHSPVVSVSRLLAVTVAFPFAIASTAGARQLQKSHVQAWAIVTAVLSWHFACNIAGVAMTLNDR